MTRRLIAAALVLGALALHVGVTRPARLRRDVAREDFARARQERERLRAQAARQERLGAAGRAPAGEAAAARALRLALLRATDGLSLGAVRIGAEAGRRGLVAARGRLSAEGPQAPLLQAADRLALPSSGLLLERVALTEAPAGGARLEIAAFSVRAPADEPVDAARRGP